jgi:hypothetical protein
MGISCAEWESRRDPRQPFADIERGAGHQLGLHDAAHWVDRRAHNDLTCAIPRSQGGDQMRYRIGKRL